MESVQSSRRTNGAAWRVASKHFGKASYGRRSERSRRAPSRARKRRDHAIETRIRPRSVWMLHTNLTFRGVGDRIRPSQLPARTEEERRRLSQIRDLVATMGDRVLVGRRDSACGCRDVRRYAAGAHRFIRPAPAPKGGDKDRGRPCVRKPRPPRSERLRGTRIH